MRPECILPCSACLCRNSLDREWEGVPSVRGLLGRVIVVKESRAEGLGPGRAPVSARPACPPVLLSQPSLRKADTAENRLQVTDDYP